MLKSGRFNLEKYNRVVNTIADGQVLANVFRDHPLQGDFSGQRECHIESDILLIYILDKDEQSLTLVDIGSHPYLFG